MGLDSVELVMAFEESFGHSISNADAATMRTPRRVVAYFRERLPRADESSCLHQQGFYTLRAHVQGAWDVPRNSVRPTTKWADVLPATRLGFAWAELGRRLLGQRALGWRPPAVLRPTASLGEAIPTLCVRYAAAMKRPGAGWSDREIAHVVASLVKDQLGVEEVPMDADFVDDLGCD